MRVTWLEHYIDPFEEIEDGYCEKTGRVISTVKKLFNTVFIIIPDDYEDSIIEVPANAVSTIEDENEIRISL